MMDAMGTRWVGAARRVDRMAIGIRMVAPNPAPPRSPRARDLTPFTDIHPSSCLQIHPQCLTTWPTIAALTPLLSTSFPTFCFSLENSSKTSPREIVENLGLSLSSSSYLKSVPPSGYPDGCVELATQVAGGGAVHLFPVMNLRATRRSLSEARGPRWTSIETSLSA